VSTLFYRLYDPIGFGGTDNDVCSQLINGLFVQGVNVTTSGAQVFMQVSLISNRNGFTRQDTADIAGLFGIEVTDVLVQRAPQGNIHQLGAAADAQHRQVFVEREPDDFLFQTVPLRIVVLVGIGCEHCSEYSQHKPYKPVQRGTVLHDPFIRRFALLAIMKRVNIRAAADYDAVKLSMIYSVFWCDADSFCTATSHCQRGHLPGGKSTPVRPCYAYSWSFCHSDSQRSKNFWLSMVVRRIAQLDLGAMENEALLSRHASISSCSNWSSAARVST